VRQTDSRRFGIDNVNRATIGDVNAEHDSTLIGDDAIAAAEFAAHRAAATIIDNCDFVSVSLLSGDQWPIAHPGRMPDFTMRGIEPLQHFGFVVRNIDAWNSLRESVTTYSNRAQRGKLLEGRPRHCD
jgi:hypothetical protein